MKKTVIFILTAALIITMTACKKKGYQEEQVYEIMNEDIIIGKGTEWELNGMLTLPKNAAEKLPAVVLIQGSGGHDMDEAAFAYKPFKDIAEYLASRGIAVLRYDKRTFTYSSEMAKNYKDITIKEETIDDAIAAADLLKNDSRIASEKIFILGHSLGGMVAPRIDAEGGNFAGIIICAGSPRRLADIWYDQQIAELNTLPDDQKETWQAQIDECMGYFNQFKYMPDEETKKYTLVGASGYYYKDLDAYPSNEYLKNTDKPVLIMQGGKDFQVSADKDFMQYQELLQDKANVTFKLYPNLNHFFITSKTGTISEYTKRDTVNSEVLKDIADWIKTN